MGMLLQGVRAVEMAFWCGPATGGSADWGADVVKIERRAVTR
jgi:crotonobetainyl-CoA:carnitine CoA-transferase CaiB-like acyl-CoA transferase